MLTETRPFAVREFLSDVKIPMSRNELLAIADKHGATDEIKNLIEFFPDVDFESLIQVEEAMEFEAGSFEPTNGHVVAHPPRKQERIEKKIEIKEKTGKLTEPGKTVKGNPDRRLAGQESEAIRSARHMEHGYDGRGYVKNPFTDARLAVNRAPIGYSPTWKKHPR